MSAYPGEEFSVGIELYDELGELTADVLRLSDETLTLQQNESQVSSATYLYVYIYCHSTLKTTCIQGPPLFIKTTWSCPINACTIDFDLCKETTSLLRPLFCGPEVVTNLTIDTGFTVMQCSIFLYTTVG